MKDVKCSEQALYSLVILVRDLGFSFLDTWQEWEVHRQIFGNGRLLKQFKAMKECMKSYEF